MAIFTRTNGDAYGVVQVDAGRGFANATIINTGIGAPINAYKIATAAAITGNLVAEGVTGGAVETILRTIAANATILAYQIDAGTAGVQQISLITERSGWETATPGAGATAIQTVLGTLGNIGVAGNVYGGTYSGSSNGLTVTSTAGIKFA
jgi:hypothetical protein